MTPDAHAAAANEVSMKPRVAIVWALCASALMIAALLSVSVRAQEEWEGCLEVYSEVHTSLFNG